MTISANPYLNRTAIKDDRHFIGRRRELATIYGRIGASEPQSVSIVGERRIGKSSLLRALCRRRREHLAKQDAYLFVLIDLQEMIHGDVASLFGALLNGISESLADDSFAQMPATYEGVRQAVTKLARSSLTLVLLLDEFDAITRNCKFDLDFFNFLRSLPNNYAVSFLVTSAVELQEICHSKEVSGSPFFNIFHKLNLVCFPMEEALDAIVQPAKLAGGSLDSYTSEILGLAGRFPMFLQMACSAYWDFFENCPGRSPDRHWIRNRFHEEAADHFASIWRHMTDREKEVCRKLCFKETLSAADATFAQSLSHRGYVEYERSGFRLFSDAFVEFLRAILEGHSRSQENLAGFSVGRFSVKRLLGKGGMGEVFLAEDTKLKRLVALKRLHSDRCNDMASRQRFLKEAERASQLTDPHIAVLHDVIEQDGLIYLVMEYVEGRFLRDLMKQPVPYAELLSIAEQACSALVSAHTKSIVHCDIKPENIVLTPTGLLKILDFGVARRMPVLATSTEPTLTVDRTYECTPAYASPEILQYREPDGRSDIFSLGIVLYEAAVGHNPFHAATLAETAHKILYFDPPRLAEIDHTIPAALDFIIQQCLTKNPADRYQESRLLLVDLRNMRIGTVTDGA